jgi:glycosyltransferase involved in cell wall biosynthesis
MGVIDLRIVMVDDCAFVGADIRKGLMNRGLQVDQFFFNGPSKVSTLMMASKLRRSRYDLVHAHYCRSAIYAAYLSGKPYIAHCHGSDVRLGVSWLKRLCLKKARKKLVSTPDLREILPDATLLPNPIDSETFYPKPILRRTGKLKVLIASSAWIAKGTDIAIHALSKLTDKVDVSIIGYGVDYDKILNLASSLHLKISTLPKTSHEGMREYYWNADLILDQFRCGVVGRVFLEAVACGRPAIGYVSSNFPEYEILPLKDIDSDESLVNAIENIEDLTNIWRPQYEYLKANHDANVVVEKVLQIYKELCGVK